VSHSEKAGTAVLGSGERATLYRALRELLCSRCGGAIREGELFTREAERASGLPLVRRCGECAPFRVEGRDLLAALLAPEADRREEPTGVTGEARKKLLTRLGPALAARRRGRSEGEHE
jgi:hypothetical protein